MYDKNVRKRSWSKAGLASQTVVKPGLTRNKVMLCVWWDWKGIIQYELLPPDRAIDSELYCKQLMRLKQEVERKRPEIINGRAAGNPYNPQHCIHPRSDTGPRREATNKQNNKSFGRHARLAERGPLTARGRRGAASAALLRYAVCGAVTSRAVAAPAITRVLAAARQAARRQATKYIH
ncbi:jg5037 [Pararge aegeria aegeria]|uniref:Jg5037 protein n=1 Tax=Pararge aegeria aegeria TaxID=348720 RepID=A0A8S4SAL8_9NEOP|nr:jg5037 [Pararge aegeria aegeria]